MLSFVKISRHEKNFRDFYYALHMLCRTRKFNKKYFKKFVNNSLAFGNSTQNFYV